MASCRIARWCTVFASLLLMSTCSARKQTEKDLVMHLLSDYNPLARPRNDSRLPVEVNLKYVLHSVDEINEQEQYLVTFSWLFIDWYDDYLAWDPADYSNTTSINLPSKLVWKPDIVVQNSMYSEITNEDGHFQAILNSDGKIELVTAGALKTGCSVDTTYFPFDRQACHIVFDSWSYDISKVVLISVALDFTYYRLNGVWNLVGNTSEVVRYTSVGTAGRSFDSAVYTLRLDRKPLYYITNIVIPCSALSMLVALVFLLPPEAGEKVSLSITILLSFTLFLLLIAEHMPVTSDYMPILAMYAVFSMMLACFSLSCTLVVLGLHYHHGQARVPVLLRRLANCFLCAPAKQAANDGADFTVHPLPSEETKPELDHQSIAGEEGEALRQFDRNMLCSLVKEVVGLMKDSQVKCLEKESRETRRQEWFQLARLLDILFLVLFLTAELIVMIVFIGIIPLSQMP